MFGSKFPKPRRIAIQLVLAKFAYCCVALAQLGFVYASVMWDDTLDQLFLKLVFACAIVDTVLFVVLWVLHHEKECCDIESPTDRERG